MESNQITDFVTVSKEIRDNPDAHRQLIERYGPAARSYFLAATRSEETAQELYHELVSKILEGRLSKFSHDGPGPYRRFRDYFKRHLALIIKEWRRTNGRNPIPSSQIVEVEVDDAEVDINKNLEQQFEKDFRRIVIGNALDTMGSDTQVGHRYATLITLRFENPEATYDELAKLWTLDSVSSKGLRDLWVRAKKMFVAVVRAEIAAQIGTDDNDEVDDEISAIALWSDDDGRLLASED